jgi:hypothetical protein
MAFYQSAEFESDMGGRYRVTRGYQTEAMRDADVIVCSVGDSWSDYETWEANPAEWPNIRIFTDLCCWCDSVANWLLSYRDENRNGDPACAEHMREYQGTYDIVRMW